MIRVFVPYTLPGWAAGAPAVARDGTIYINSYDHTFRAVTRGLDQVEPRHSRWLDPGVLRWGGHEDPSFVPLQAFLRNRVSCSRQLI
jgi:hypothetical protein